MVARSQETKAFLLAHLFLLGVVLIGFARSFYLRGFFMPLSLPSTLIFHGVALTLWYAIVVLQGGLILTGRPVWHARIAWLIIPIVAGVLVSGTQVNMNVAMQITSAADPENMFVWGNFMSLVSFAVLVTAGVLLRHRFAAHRRMMLFASLAIIGPAFARFAFWPVIGLGIVAAPIFAIAGMILLVALAITYDVKVCKRVQPAT